MMIFVVTSLLMLSAILHHYGIRTASESSARLDDRMAFYLAETALSEAMTAVRAGRPGDVGSQAAPAYFAGGAFWVQATPMGVGQTQLVSTALWGRGRAALEAQVEVDDTGPVFETVLNSFEGLTLNADVEVDSFDSKVGSYASQAVNVFNGHVYANDNGDVISNSDITLNARATVFGDATPGIGHSVTMGTDAYISGSTTPAPNPFSFPPIEVPVLASAGPLDIPNAGSTTLPAGDHAFDNLTIGTDGILTIEGPANIVCNDLTGGRRGRVVIDATNGPVTFYVEGTYTHQQEFEAVPVAGSPMAVAFLFTMPQEITFPGATNIRGAYYGPTSNITFTSDNEVWGAIAFNRIDMSNDMQFHFDEVLADYWRVKTGAAGDFLVVHVWRKVGVTPDSLTRDRRDPFTVLGVEKGDLLSPSQSWGN